MHYLRGGRLGGVKVGRLWRVRERDLEVFLSSRQGRHSQGRPSSLTPEDVAWLDTDLSRLGEIEPYEWGPGGPPKGKPIRYEPGVGVVVADVGDEEHG